jgi:hypothetical protein
MYSSILEGLFVFVTGGPPISMRASRAIYAAKDTVAPLWNVKQLPYRMLNMIEQNNPGFEEFGPRYWTGVGE